MKVLLAASEVAPIVKLGGLGDVIGSLPMALEKLDVNIDVIVPFYPVAKTENLKLYKALEIEVPFDNGAHMVEVFKTKLPGSDVDVILLKNSEYFVIGGRDAFRKDRSETEMFAFFCRAVVEFIKSQFNTYDLVHCNDWHTGMITHLLEDEIGKTRPATLLTIHNLAYQGIADLELVQELGIDPGEHQLIEYDLRDNDINFMYQGVTSSDYLNSVSPTYAKEILTEEYGGNLTEIMQAREARLTGILNGIGYDQFPKDYDLKNWRDKKSEHKNALRKELSLRSGDSPIYSYISRLDPNQKGIDILYHAIPEVISNGGQFVILGTGDKGWEEKLKELGSKKEYEGSLSINIMFDIKLARNIYAGSDFLVIPSKYEPCGLTQMIAMWYGTVPVVRATGGLKDTVKEGENGFTFDEYSDTQLSDALNRARKLFGSPKFDDMIETCMKKDFSWDKSAVVYKELYEKVIRTRRD